MKLCNVCKEIEAVSGGRCQDCKSAISLGVSPSSTNHKWLVAIKECEFGHKYVPVKGRCLYCEKQRNYETTENMPDMPESSEESDVAWRWVL